MLGLAQLGDIGKFEIALERIEWYIRANFKTSSRHRPKISFDTGEIRSDYPLLKTSRSEIFRFDLARLSARQRENG